MADRINPRNTRKPFDLDIFQRYLVFRVWAQQCRAENDRTGYGRATRYADRLRDRLFIENRTLLNKLGEKYARKMRSNLPDEDVRQVAYYAFVEYLDRYDFSRGLFSTYIDSWIRHEMQQAGRASDIAPNQPRVFRMPMALRRLDDEVFTREGRGVTLAEAVACGTAQDPPFEVTAEDLDRWRQGETHVDSLDAPTPFRTHSEDVPQSMHDTISDPDAFDVEKALIGEAGTETLVDALTALAPMEQRIIKGLFLDEKSPASVAAEIGVGSHELEVLRDVALRKLRAALSS
jgi:RNA polymerase sigma factor (sigma-70 family)